MFQRRCKPMEGGREVCLEEEVEKMRRSGMSTGEISEKMGVDPAWVESLISMWGLDDEPSTAEREPERE
jgi:hypothetical protein